jgi:hypothetical protein
LKEFLRFGKGWLAVGQQPETAWVSSVNIQTVEQLQDVLIVNRNTPANPIFQRQQIMLFWDIPAGEFQSRFLCFFDRLLAMKRNHMRQFSVLDNAGNKH